MSTTPTDRLDSVTTLMDEFFLARALDLAWRGVGCTHPNPIVGAVVVSGGEVVGEGFHNRCGGPHAETAALVMAGERARGATLYVSLEPCSHHGRTPPCVDAITEAGVGRVVIPSIDPDPRVKGKGVEVLRARGIEVSVGRLFPNALLANLGYFKQRLGAGVTVTLKMAVTWDGKIASSPGHRDDITGDPAQRFVHELRSAHDAVLVGIGTLLTDRPALDCRRIEVSRVPTPVVLDRSLRFPEDYPWMRSRRRFVVVAGSDADPRRVRSIERGGGTVLVGSSTLPTPGEVVALLAQAGIRSVLVEGGAGVFTAFLRENLWDTLYLLSAPRVFGAAGLGLADGAGGVEVDAVAVSARTLGRDGSLAYLNSRTIGEIERRLSPAGGMEA